MENLETLLKQLSDFDEIESDFRARLKKMKSDASEMEAWLADAPERRRAHMDRITLMLANKRVAEEKFAEAF